MANSLSTLLMCRMIRSSGDLRRCCLIALLACSLSLGWLFGTPSEEDEEEEDDDEEEEDVSNEGGTRGLSMSLERDPRRKLHVVPGSTLKKTEE